MTTSRIDRRQMLKLEAAAIANYNKSQVNLLAALGLLDQANVAPVSAPKSVTK